MDDGWVLCHILPFLCTISVLVMQDTQLQHTTKVVNDENSGCTAYYCIAQLIPFIKRLGPV
jgi:hypothetical protein